MRWFYFLYFLFLYSEICAATVSMANFTKIAHLEFNPIPMQHFCGISAINCASKCDAAVGCSAFNYNRGIRTCRLLNFDLFDQGAWPEFAKNQDWTVYVKEIPQGRTTLMSHMFVKPVFLKIKPPTDIPI